MTSLWAGAGPWNTAIDAIAIDVFSSSSSASTNTASNVLSLSMMSLFTSPAAALTAPARHRRPAPKGERKPRGAPPELADRPVNGETYGPCRAAPAVVLSCPETSPGGDGRWPLRHRQA